MRPMEPGPTDAAATGAAARHTLGGDGSRRAGVRAHDGRSRQARLRRPRSLVRRRRRFRGAAGNAAFRQLQRAASGRSEEHTSELQSLMRISYAVFCLKKTKTTNNTNNKNTN